MSRRRSAVRALFMFLAASLIIAAASPVFAATPARPVPMTVVGAGEFWTMWSSSVVVGLIDFFATTLTDARPGSDNSQPSRPEGVNPGTDPWPVIRAHETPPPGGVWPEDPRERTPQPPGGG